MKKIIEKRNYIILLIIIGLIIWIFLPKRKAYVKTFNFNNANITYVIYEKVNNDKVSKNIDKIYKKYKKRNLNKKEKKYIYDQTNGFLDMTNNYLLNYSTNKVLKYFKSNSIKRYMVNIDGDVILGDKYSNNKYSVSIHDPGDNSILKIMYFSNKALSSTNYSDDLKNLKGNRKDYDMVSVLCDDILTSNIISNYLYYLPIKEGKKVLSKKKCDGLWYKDGKIITSSNFSKYFNKKL